MTSVPEHNHIVRYTELFAAQLDAITSRNAYERVKRRLLTIVRFPMTGSATPRESLTERYGDDIRTSSAGNYVIIYKVEEDVIMLLAVVYGPAVS